MAKKMGRREFLKAAGTAGLAVSLSPLGYGMGRAAASEKYPGLSQMKPVEITFSAYVPSAHTVFETLNPYFKKVEDLSGGKVKFKTFAGGVLMKAQETLRALTAGTVPCALVTTTYFTSFIPRVNLIGDILLLTDDASATCGATTELLLSYPDFFEDELKKNNVYMLGGLYSTNPYITICNKPLRTLEDFKGKKIRTAGAAWVRLANALGVTSVSIPITEGFEGLQRGTIDGVWGAAEFLRSYNLWDVAKYVNDYPTGCYCGTCALTFNRDFWNQLPKPAREIIMDEMAFVPAGVTLISYGSVEEKTRAEAPKRGVQFIQPDPELKKTIDEFKAGEVERAADWASKNRRLDRQVCLDILRKFEELYKKWQKISKEAVKEDVHKLTAVMNKEIYEAAKAKYAK